MQIAGGAPPPSAPVSRKAGVKRLYACGINFFFFFCQHSNVHYLESATKWWFRGHRQIQITANSHSLLFSVYPIPWGSCRYKSKFLPGMTQIWDFNNNPKSTGWVGVGGTSLGTSSRARWKNTEKWRLSVAPGTAALTYHDLGRDLVVDPN